MVTYVGGVQKSYRHVYCWGGNGATRVHFRFSVSSDVFKQPGVMGRPKGVFNADCHGYTPQGLEIPGDVRPNIRQDEDPNTPQRFPRATSFADHQEAAIECDFWKLVLRRRFYLEIPWSHDSYEGFIEAANNAQRDPVADVLDESKWTHELVDFINQHQTKLLEHRDAHKPEVDLDQWEQQARNTGDHRIKTWVDIAREYEKDLAKFTAVFSDRKLNQIRNLVNCLTGAAKTDMPEHQKNRSDFSEDANRLRELVQQAVSMQYEAEKIFERLDDTKRELTRSLKRHLETRPSSV